MSETEWDGNEFENEEEKRVLFAALDSFFQYSKVAKYNTTHLRRQSFYALPRAHWELLAAPPFSYLDTLNAVDDAIDKNAELAYAILHCGLQSFGLSIQPRGKSDEEKDPNDWRGTATSNDMEKARSTLRQFYRDWSEEGASERSICYGPVIQVLHQERANRSSTVPPLKVLVPGAGLGRLVFDLSSEGFDTEGNEISYHQLLASSYILNHCSRAKEYTIYPWIHSFSNLRNRSNHLEYFRIPDVHPGTFLAGDIRGEYPPGDMSMSASDFLLLYGDENHKSMFDAVATVFFLDTAPNIIRYFEVIQNCLKPGGLLINIGPLLWHFENNAPGTHGKGLNANPDPNNAALSNESPPPGIAEPGSVELTDDEVIALIEKMGFDIEKRESGITAPYIQNPQSMMQNTYRASFWTARKRQ
ncbi:N2227-like protein-domain-containing protein [Xylogone sp. PMI_703]|nr:N2227-like protein-domain-containing protein [Xylogone sp. PMI_703]